MISVTVKLFAQVKEIAGSSERNIQLNDGSVAADVLTYFEEQIPSLREFRRYVRIAVNQTYVPLDHMLANGDEVAIIPPVSGGKTDELA
jgi:molybdopterin converting factor subunit 1